MTPWPPPAMLERLTAPRRDPISMVLGSVEALLEQAASAMAAAMVAAVRRGQSCHGALRVDGRAGGPWIPGEFTVDLF